MKRLLPLALALIVAGQQPVAVRAQAARAIRSLVAAPAVAVVKGDQRAFDATMSLAPASFRKARDAWFTRLQSLPLGSYGLEVVEDAYADLAPALAARPAADEVHVVEVTQHLGFRGYDKTASADDLFLTVVRQGSRWSIVSDDALEDVGLESVRDLWDFGPVTADVRNGVLALSHGDKRAPDIAAATAASAKRDHQVWPLPWDEHIIDAIPATRAELGRILEITFDLGPFVAFTTSSLDRAHAEFRLTGHRVYIQPQNFFADSPAYRTDTLGHELIHLATRAAGGAFTPAWLDEGVAQVYGQGTVATDIGRAPRLPDDWEFNIGSGAEINLAYARAANFITWMRKRFGNAAPARLYEDLGRESAVSFGTRRYHLDRASRVALKMPFDAVVRAWQRVEGKR